MCFCINLYLRREKLNNVKIGTASANFLPKKNIRIPLTFHKFVFFSGDRIVLASRLSFSGALLRFVLLRSTFIEKCLSQSPIASCIFFTFFLS